jgi:putative hemolysin
LRSYRERTMKSQMCQPGNESAESSAAFSGLRVLTRSGAASAYQLRRAKTTEDLRSAQALRFLVFNLELNEGLESSFSTLRDEDPFDAACDHLLVEDQRSGEVVGTYRLQTGRTATERLGFYSAQEFDFSVYEGVRNLIVELGRACVHRDHRNLHVLGLLWRGIADYARENGGRYLVGCSSLTSQDPGVGVAAYAMLAPNHLVEPAFRTVPTAKYACGDVPPSAEPPKIPKLLRAYLSFGARICGPAAIDRDFKTIDFLTWLDLEQLPESARRIVG